MRILGIETTGAFASVALLSDETVLARIEGHDRFSHLQNLMPQVKTVLEKSELSLGDLDGIAVSAGPGSFTGIRIGISSARALSQVSGLPCAAVSSLEALALRADGHVQGEVLVCPLIDARRNQVYAGGYCVSDIGATEDIAAGPYMFDEFMSLTAGYKRILALGDGASRYENRIYELRPEGVEFAGEEWKYQDAVTVARIGMRIVADGEAVSYNMLEPQYMRIPEAERKLREKSGVK